MLRERSLLSARTLTRTLRAGSRPRPSRALKLRLDTLESREQPGNVMSLGLAGAGMLEPLQVMAAVVGTKVPSKSAGTPGNAGRPTTRPALSLPALSSRPTTATGPDAAAGRRSDSAAPAVKPSSDAARAPLDFSDLSITDPAKDSAPTPQPVLLHGGGSSGGAGGGSSASAPASQTTAQGPATYAGTPITAADSSSPLVTEPSAPAAGTVITRQTGSAPLGAIVAAPPAEVFVTPPADVINREPPALSPPTVPQATTLRPTYAVGTDAGGVGRVRAYNAITGQLRYGLQPFNSSFQGGVRVAIGDVSGDGVGELVAGKGPGGDNRVKVFGGWDHNPLPGARGSFLAFPTTEADGVNVAAGDINGDGKADVIVGADGAGGHRVRVWSGANHALLRDLDLTAYGLTGGIRVAAGDINGDGKADVLAAGGAGSAGRVAVFDGATGAALYNFFPFGPDYLGGVTVAAGDVTGDGHADVIAGQEAEGSWVKVFSGRDTASTWNLEAFPGSTSGVRVGTADADGDGRVDVLAADAGGDGRVRAFASDDGGLVRDVEPFGTEFTRGLFVGGDGRGAAYGALSPARRGRTAAPDLPETDTVPTVTISMDRTATPETGGGFKVTVTRDITTSGLTVFWTWGGTATNGTDYTAVANATLMPGQASYTSPAAFPTTSDTVAEPGGETVVATLTASVNYSIGSPGSATVLIVDDDAPTPTAPVAKNLMASPDPVAVAPGTAQAVAAGAVAPARAVGGVSVDGSVSVSTCPAFADLTWSNAIRFGDDAGGDDRQIKAATRLEAGGSVLYLWRSDQVQAFDAVSGSYTARDGAPELMSEDTTNKQFTLTDSTGARLIFHSFDSSLPAGQRGRLKSAIDPAGNTVATATYNGSGQVTSIAYPVTTGGTTTTSTISYTYLTSGTNSGKISTITLAETVGGGSPVTVRTADLAYYDGTTSGGTAGDLNTAIVKDGASPTPNTLETHYWRYYTSASSTGYAGALKFAVTGAAYERMAKWATDNLTTVDAMTDAEIAPFADIYLEFDEAQRVTKVDVGAGGCSACFGGIGSYTYSYAISGFAVGYNSWHTKRAETRPDGSVVVTYANYAGEPLLVVHQEGGSEWVTYFRYDTSSRLVLAANPSAVSGYDATYADLLNNQSGNYQHLRDAQGLISTLTYGTSTTATSTTAGTVTGYLSATGVQRGETGTSVLQGSTDYLSNTSGTISNYPVANSTVYRNTNGTGGQTTNYAYTWDDNQPLSITTTLPTVTTAQNGSNSATSDVVVLDSYGRNSWLKDAGGFITYLAFDDATGAVTKVIRDVDTTQTGTFSNLPSGWTTPSGAGLHLTSAYEVDDLGRTTKETDPNGNITYIVFNDVTKESRVYAGWDTGSNLPTGPTIVQREDRAWGYRETLTMSATPSLTSSRPNGTEAISGVQSLSRQVLNSVGQVVYMDQYVSLSGTSYSASSVTLGSSGTNYNRTQQDYDKLGRPNRTLSATSTIYRTFSDGQGRPVSQWVGTDDTPTTGFWSPTNTAGTDLVKVWEAEYDGGGVGDSLLTKSIEIPGGGAANRVTAMSYDWRNRTIASKSGVETSESTALHRPISYVEYDNLSQPIINEMYDGDGLSITTDSNSDGVPDRPSSSAMRAKSTNDFDELGRTYKSSIFSVDPTSGSVSTNSLKSNTWFNSRGRAMKSSSPGGLVVKSEFDGVGRTTKSYVTDGGSDSGYTDADDVTGDTVLSQTEYGYDANSNVILTTNRQRFHDETGTGALGTPSTGNKARVSYAAAYVDKSDRTTATVDVGTNGGSAYTRPSTVPSRSDTVLVTDIGYNAAGRAETVTDPRGLVSKTYFDLGGQTTKTIENYVDGTVSDVDDKTVEYTYHANGQMQTLKAYLTGGGYQETQWVYGITSPVVSNDVLKETRYPDTSTGAANSSDKDAYTYNQVGQVLTKTDRNGSVHAYSYDILGRQVSDAITTLGSGVDGAVRRVETAHDTQGNPYLLTSYDAASSGSVVNQVQRAYNGLGQLITEYQAVGGAVNTSTTPKVQYSYSEMASGANHSRLTSITYPNGRVLTYNDASGLDDAVSRLSSITDGSTTLESYQYLGYDTVVSRAHPEPGVDLTYIKLSGESDGAAGDKYVGLDAFGRIIDQRWTTSGGTAKDRRQSGYDRNSNRVYADNLVSTSNSELYTYDGLNQLATFDRGTLNGGRTAISGSPTRSQSWNYDALGNFDSQTTDATTQTRSANKQNEITSISGATTPTYDANGNLTTDESGRTFKYDAWNRLVEVRNSGSTLLATYRYDALGGRIRETRGSTTTDLYYSAGWQVLEERVGSAVQMSYAWSPVYVDALIARDRDTDANGSLDERLYATHDANWNVTALMNTSGTVVERFVYDPYGGVTILTGAWGARAISSYAWQYLHQGGRWDTDAGLYSFRNREYSPSLGRWVQLDPIGFNGGEGVVPSVRVSRGHLDWVGLCRRGR